MILETERLILRPWDVSDGEGQNRTEHVSCITKEAWLQRKENER